MRCPASDPGFAANPIHGAAAQLLLIKQVLRHVKGRGIAFDVGAHIGTWTIPLAGQFRSVIALEPQPENYECLTDNVRGLGNVRTLRLAAGGREGRADLACTDNSGTYWLVSGNAVECGSVIVMPLNNVALGLWPKVDCTVDFIKLDVEGMEGRALRGASLILERDRPAVFFEDNGLGAQHYGPSWVDPKDVLREHGYYQRGRMAKNELWLPR